MDYSGSVEDNKTWFVEGTLNGNTLCIEKCEPITREDLKYKLAREKQQVTVAMDFPFGIPERLRRSFPVDTKTPVQLWRIVAKMERCAFVKLQPEWNNEKRKADQPVSSSMAPLNLRMVRMTYDGIRMLHDLNRDSLNFHIPPFCQCVHTCHPRTLLEVMPSVTLRSLQIFKYYKTASSERKAKESRDNRLSILRKIPEKSGIQFDNLTQFLPLALNYDDCLDAIVAAITAAMWNQTDKDFYCLNTDQQKAACLEGRIHSPRRYDQ